MAKVAQGLTTTSNNAATQTLGWFSMHYWLSYKRLIFLWSILVAKMDCIYKRVLIERFTQFSENIGRNVNRKSPIYMMYETCIEFGMVDFVTKSILSGSYVSKSNWK
jgi:hypothetical protein